MGTGWNRLWIMGNEGCLLKRAFDFKWSLKMILFMEIYARSANLYIQVLNV